MIEIDLEAISKNELATILIQKDQEIKRLHSIIKEVREYIEDNNFLDWTLGINTELGELKLRQKELLKILDKEKDNGKR